MPSPGVPASRLIRLQDFELIIFVVTAILFALCLCAVPLVASLEAGAAASAPAPGHAADIAG